MLKPFDVVRTPNGTTALVVEVSDTGKACLSALDRDGHRLEKNAWWFEGDLTLLGNAMVVIANAMAHPSGGNRDQGDRAFPR